MSRCKVKATSEPAEVWRRYKTDPLYHCTFVETMRVVVGLLLLLLGLCGSGAQGEAGGLGEVAEINQNTDPKHAAEESTEQTTKQTTCDIWTELRALRDMVVELNVHVELLQRENSVQATELTSLGTRLTATESKTSDLEKENADLQTRLSSSESELLISRSRIDQLERENAGVQVYKNDQRIMYNVEKNNEDWVHQYFTNSLVLELTAGDEIHLVLPSGCSIYDDSSNHTTFSGSLLFTL